MSGFIPNVTADMLFMAARIGPNGDVMRDDGGLPETQEEEDELEARNFRLTSRHLALVQQGPIQTQYATYAELAAKYLPKLVEAFRKRRTPNNAPMVLINAVAYSPYFLRFSKTPAGADLARIQAKRMAHADFLPMNEPHTTIAEACQFLSTLLVVYCLDFDHETDREPLLERLHSWRNTYRGEFTQQMAQRCIDMLEPDTEQGKEMSMMMCVMRMTLGLGVDMCAIKQCESKKEGAELLQCSRCKTVRYCGSEHQRQDWPDHKTKCYPAAF